MVDLHSHALFGIDDGAQTIEDSLAILKRAESFGIKKMALTPHFTIGDDVQVFLDRRQRRFEMLKPAMEEENINIKLCLGAEVYITDELFNETELKKLTIGDSNVILAEFKYHGLHGEDLLQYVDELIKNGLKVLIAHPERYSYLNRNMMLIRALIDRGVMLQVNAISLFEDSDVGDAARAMVAGGFAYNLGSDIHHASSRRLDAIGKIGEGQKWNNLVRDNPARIFDNLF